MKRMDYWRRLHNLRVKYKRERRKEKWRKKVHRRRSARFMPHAIQAPAIFDLLKPDHRSRVLSFLRMLRTEAKGATNISITLDFTDTRKLVSAATLLLKAELARLIRITTPNVRFRCIGPRNRKVAQVLKQTGIFKLLEHRSSVVPTYDDVVHWRSATGNLVDGARYDQVLGHYDGVIPESVANGLYLGLTEAMTNCHHHAYIAQRQDGMNQTNEPKEWWMFSQEREGSLTVVFCDLGVGIPETLPIKQPGLWQRLKTAVGAPTDAEAISEAIADSRSRTQKHYRGKGLRQLVEVIERTPGADLILYSNRGCYISNQGSVSTQNFDDSILGTLIGWRVPLASRNLS